MIIIGTKNGKNKVLIKQYQMQPFHSSVAHILLTIKYQVKDNNN